MNRKLTARSSLENLRKEAKRWLNALRASDADARQRLREAYPAAPAQPSLREVQHALAREYGLANWAAFKTSLDEIALATSSREKLVAEFLEHSCLHYGIRPATSKWDRAYGDAPSRWQYAARILAPHPEIASHSIHTAAVCGDLAEVERILAARPAAANEKGGPQAWEPLLYVCYGRLPIASAGENAVAIAGKLLDAGAGIDARLAVDDFSFVPLTGAIGGGEFAQPAHPNATALATLLIDRGADPYDAQALYNTSLENDDLFWLDFLYQRSAKLNETGKWTASSPRWPQSGMLNYLLGNAVSRNGLARAKWLLARGADPATAHYYTKRKVHAEALLLGYTEMADLLQSFGNVAEALRAHDAFQVACMRLDRDAANAMALEHPEYLLNAAPLIQAATRDLLEVATLLLDLGMSPEVRDHNNFRPLHAAASADALRVGALLIERGAEIDPVESRFNGVPLGWALHGNSHRMIALLGGLSRTARALVRMGNLERLRELFAESPTLAMETNENGSLFAYLPQEEDRAAAIAELLLAFGADPRVRNQEGLNAIQYLEQQGLDAVADMLESHVNIPTTKKSPSR
jgi:hypothetical protein